MASAEPLVVSLNVGQAEALGFEGAAEWFEQPWTTAIFKSPIEGPAHVNALGLRGDAQADRTVHGGVDKAVCVYPGDHYPAWRAELGIEEFGPGAFGENFTVSGLAEDAVCIGDIWAVGEIVLEVSQPRQPCWKLARKWRIKELTARAVESGRTGWYFRVLREGLVRPGDALALTSRTAHRWTVSAANGVMHHRIGDPASLIGVEALSASWKKTLQSRVAS